VLHTTAWNVLTGISSQFHMPVITSACPERKLPPLSCQNMHGAPHPDLSLPPLQIRPVHFPSDGSPPRSPVRPDPTLHDPNRHGIRKGLGTNINETIGKTKQPTPYRSSLSLSPLVFADLRRSTFLSSSPASLGFPRRRIRTPHPGAPSSSPPHPLSVRTAARGVLFLTRSLRLGWWR
jgi:hypothetical protein